MTSRLVVCAAVALLVLSSCTQTPSPETPVGPDQARSLADYLLPQDEVSDRPSEQLDDLIAACMAAAGFEYLASDPLEPGSTAYLARYGYGIVTPVVEGLEVQADDASIAESRPSEERIAYEEALWGASFDPASLPTDDDGLPIYPDFEEQGCDGRARSKLIADGPLPSAELVDVEAELTALLQGLDEEVRADPRVVQLEDEWSVCMKGEGYDFDDPAEPRRYLSESLADLLGFSFTFATGTEDRSPLEYPGRFGPEFDQAALETLAAEELSIAAADHRCRGDLDERVSEIRAEHEPAFVAEHRELLERYRTLVAG